MVTSARKLAEVLGVAASTVAGYLKREDWPVRRTPPWSGDQVELIRAWRGGLQEDRRPAEAGRAGGAGGAGGDTSERKRQADMLRAVHRARREKVAADRDEGKVVDRAVLDDAIVAYATLVVKAGDEAFDRLARRLVELGVSAAEAEAAAREAWFELRERIASAGAIELDQVDVAVRESIAKRRGARGRVGVEG